MAHSGRKASPNTALQPARIGWSFLLVGGVLGLTQLGFYLTAAALPLYLRDLGAAQGRIGLEVGLGNFAALLVTLFLGPAINRYGPQRFLRLGAAFYLITTLGMLLLGNEFAVTGFRTLQGVAAALIGPSTFVLGSQLLPERRGMAIGVLGVLNSLALAIGPPIGLTLYTDHGATWLFFPATVVAAAGLLSTAALPKIANSAEAARGFGFDRIWIPSIVSNFLSVMYFGGIVAYLPIFLRHAHGPNAGIFFTADAVGVLLLRVPTGILVDRRGSFAPKLIGLAITIPGIAALALSPSIGALVIAGLFTGIGAGLFITGVMADLSNLSTDANRGMAMSMGTASFSASIFAGSAISGALIGPGGFDAILLFGEITTLAALPFLLWRPHAAVRT
jgi:MFS family permease